MNFPTSLDNGTSLPNPTGTATQNNPDHGALHTSENAAIIAVETKLGTGSTTPASSTLLIGTGAGTSAWSALTSAQLAAVLSDETGSGSAVFANTPVLITPKVDTINENTLNNGVTVGGVNLKSGAISTSNVVPTAAIQDNAITASKLATNTITLGYAQITASTAVNNTSTAVAAGLSQSVTIPSGGRRTVIVAYAPILFNNTVNGQSEINIWDGTVASGIKLQSAYAANNGNAGTSGAPTATVIAIVSPAAGAKTYNIGYNLTTGSNAQIFASATTPAFIWVGQL